MKRRYRSLRREQIINIKPGLKIRFVGFRYPQPGEPPCENKTIINAIENKKGFGKLIWEEKSPEDILIDPQKVPPDTELQHLQNAARQLHRMGLHVNPDLLLKDDDVEEEPVGAAEEKIQLTKTIVNQSTKQELLELIEQYGWTDIDQEMPAKDIKAAIKAKIDGVS
jgi:hypothetical protein